MTKRRKSRKSAPNLPDEVLERARRQAMEDSDAVEDDEDVESAEEEDEAPPVVAEASPRESRRERRQTQDRGNQSSRRRRSQPEAVQFSGRREREKNGKIDSKRIQEMLAHPTKFVTEQELREEYGYVLNDLKSMGALAAVLAVVLVLLAQFI
jgi:hypothetical protein